jgi:amidase
VICRIFVALVLSTSLAHAQPRRAFDVHEASIRELQDAMSSGRITSAGLVEAYLARIASFDRSGPSINSMIRLNPRAREQAAALDAERRAGRVRGIWHGIPVILKDNFESADMPATGGSAALASVVAAGDGFLVRRLRDAGAIILGLSNMQELAFGFENASSLGGQTLNPYDLRRCPGGSSGGTGAAIAASFAAIGWGTDTCGSIRVPSSFNNLVGLRPTQGLASRAGIIPLTLNGDMPGPMARSVTDLAIGLDITVGEDAADTTTRALRGRSLPRFVDSLATASLRGARIGIFLPYFREAHPDVAAAVRSAIAVMKAQGAEVIDVIAPLDTFAANTSLVFAEMGVAMDEYLARMSGAPVRTFSELVATGLHHETADGRIRPAAAIPRDSAPLRAAVVNQRRASLRTAILKVMDSLRLDVLVYPSTRQLPALVGETPLGINCALAAHSGFPSLAMPAGFTVSGVPVGMEMMGRPFTDARIVSLGYALERANPLRRPPPSTPSLVQAPARRMNTQVLANGARASATVWLDENGLLSWNVVISGTPASEVLGVYLQHVDSAGVARVVHRLVPPRSLHSDGSGLLTPAERTALQAGRMHARLLTRTVPLGAAATLANR